MSGDPLPTIKQALLTISKLQAKLDAELLARTEPIAILGMGCRMPGGAATPEDFWRLLEARADAISSVPPERWRLNDSGQNLNGADRRAVRWGSFLKDVDLFDAGFFAISPREAKTLDPQQRLLLEVSWEALERAGQPPDQLVGTRTGVFVGIVNNDYEALCNASGSTQDVYTVTGNGHCFPAGRISYVLGLQGPSLAVDTACSSSLVAVHLACQSLRSGESTLALAGGVNLMLTPLATELLATAHALSPDGRSKAFDAEANGLVRGEGCGMVVLKCLSHAIADGDPILAVIRGSAVNQDGRSAGLTAPNVQAQKALLRQALQNAGVSAAELDYVETHGTGTPLGDPIEMAALSEVLGRARADGSTCLLGALKTNIGHLEAAAGIAGLIKVVLALGHQAIPPNLHLRNINPRISLAGTPFVLPSELHPWRAGTKRRLAGVSSFGMIGTNAHAILEEAPRLPASETSAEGGWVLLPLSARSPQALRALAQSYLDLLGSASANDTPSLVDIAYTASVRRSHHDHRLALAISSREQLLDALRATADGTQQPSGLSAPIKVVRRPKVVFVFPGQGGQWLGMGRELLAEQPVFRAAIAQCDAAIQKEAGWSLLSELQAEAESSRLEAIDVIQPALFAIEVALAALWRSWGIEPDAVVGHSMGEIAAAHVSGALGLADAVRIICRRAKLLRRLSGKGAMALVELPLAEAEAVLAGQESALSIAASNGPRSTILSGDPARLDLLLSKLQQQGVFCRRVKADVATHCPQVETLSEELLAALRGLAPQPARLAMHSTVMNKVCTGKELDETYWVQNMRAPVRFLQALQQLLATEHTVFVELGPHPVLLPALTDEIQYSGKDGVGLPSLRRERDDQRVLLETLGELYARGCDVNWRALFPSGGRCVPLPTYPWQRERYWVDAGTPAAQGLGPLSMPRPQSSGQPLLGRSFEAALQPGTRFWELEVSLEKLPYLANHQIDGEVVLPADFYLELARAASAQAFGPKPQTLHQVQFERLLALPQGTRLRLQVTLEAEKDGRAPFQILSNAPTRSGWLRHAAGYVELGNEELRPAPRSETPIELTKRCAKETGAARNPRLGVCPAEEDASGVQALWLGQRELLAHVRAPDEDEDKGKAQTGPPGLHPALWDVCFQAGTELLMSQVRLSGDPDGWVPTRLDALRVLERPGRWLWVHWKLDPEQDAGSHSLELRLLDDAGQVLVHAQGLHVRQLAPAQSPSCAELRAVQSDTSRQGGLDSQLRATLAKAASDARTPLLESHIREHLARVLHQDAWRLDRLETLGNLGMDSVMAQELRNRLEASLGLKLSATTVFGYPTIAALAEHLLAKLRLAEPAAVPKGPEASPLASESVLSAPDAAHSGVLEVDEIMAAIAGSLERMESRIKAHSGGIG